MNVASDFTTMEIVQDIKLNKNSTLRNDFLSSYLISSRLSPYLSGYYISRKVVPNKITLYMIISGVIGGILFAMPNILFKILGALVIHLWFVLDCSDGEVARYTKTFSKFGKEMDYIAHLIDHPFFGFALFLSLNQLGRYNPYYLAGTIILSNFLDYLYRNVISLYDVIDLKEAENRTQNNTTIDEKWNLKSIVGFVVSIFIIYPNLILFGVLIYFIDLWAGSSLLYSFIIISNGLTLIYLLKMLKDLTIKFYKS